jgi:hypothetical protein
MLSASRLQSFSCIRPVVLIAFSAMPSNFYCNACKLRFSVGWFHYHDSSDGYGAETLLVCSACGTMHTVQHPTPVFRPILWGLFQKRVASEKKDRLMAQESPLFAEVTDDSILGITGEGRECKISHELCPPSKHDYMKGFIDLAPVECHYCQRKATLVKEWSMQNVRCPACGKPELSHQQTWMT